MLRSITAGRFPPRAPVPRAILLPGFGAGLSAVPATLVVLWSPHRILFSIVHLQLSVESGGKQPLCRVRTCER